MAERAATWIVVGVDGSPGSDRDIEWAVQEAIVRGAGLELVSAWSVPQTGLPALAPAERQAFDEEARATLDRARAAVDGAEHVPAEVRSTLVEDNAAQALIAAGERAELLVVGSRGRGGFAGLVLGSVSQQCAIHAPCPVAVVPLASDAQPHGRIVVGVDGSEPSYGALHWAVAEASARRASLDVVNAYHYVPVVTPFGPAGVIDPEELDKASRALLEEMVAGAVGLKQPELPVELITSASAPAAALLRVATGADLLVVGSRGRGGFRGLLLGSVSQHCIHHATCPVVVVRPHATPATES
jgi:nucleotide-binding universal stress UspA family protein